jgi:hypothetical protein
MDAELPGLFCQVQGRFIPIPPVNTPLPPPIFLEIGI